MTDKFKAADDAAVKLKLAYRQDKWGIVYHPYSPSTSFRNGYLAAKADEQPALKVTLRAYPESNGKRNWTAAIERVERVKDMLIGTNGGSPVQGGRGEYWNRVAYAAEEARVLLGLRQTEPDILAYGDDVMTSEEWKGCDPESGFVKFHKLFDRWFKVAAEFENTIEGTTASNDFMTANEGVGVLEVINGKIVLAWKADNGIELDERGRAK